MKTYGDQFIIKYNLGSVRNVEVGGVVIEIAAECNTDVRGNSDYIGIIECAPEGHELFKAGDKVCTHYLASHKDKGFEHEGVVYHRVPLSSIFFRINEDESFDMNDKVYLCSFVVNEAPKSPSGIILDPYGDKREPMRLKVLEVPKNSREINVGDKVISQDDYQYTLKYNGVEYVQINYDHIIASYYEE
jgi:co-chaperonin GroES (HSP10)